MSPNHFLVFQLYGPMCSFGDTAVGEYRPSLAYPSRTAIFGLLAGALGIRRDQETEHARLHTSLGFGTMVLNAGELLRDYHTSEVPSSTVLKQRPARTRREELSHTQTNTILSSRDYRQDAIFRVVIWSKSNDKQGLEQLKDALQKPLFTPYLGRKSCPPALPFAPTFVQVNSAKRALIEYQNPLDAEYFREISGTFPNGQKNAVLFCLEQEGCDKDVQGQIVWHRDRLINRKNWQFGDMAHVVFTEEI